MTSSSISERSHGASREDRRRRRRGEARRLLAQGSLAPRLYVVASQAGERPCIERSCR